VYIVLIEEYNLKQTIIITLKTESDIHFKQFFFVKTILILKRMKYNLVFFFIREGLVIILVFKI